MCRLPAKVPDGPGIQGFQSVKKTAVHEALRRGNFVESLRYHYLFRFEARGKTGFPTDLLNVL